MCWNKQKAGEGFIWTNRGWGEGYLLWLLTGLELTSLGANEVVLTLMPSMGSQWPRLFSQDLGQHPQGPPWGGCPLILRMLRCTRALVLPPFVMSLLTSLRFAVPRLPGQSQGPTLPLSAVPPTCSFSV